MTARNVVRGDEPQRAGSHGIVTHAIDKEGRWRANFHGLKFEPNNLVIFVNALVNDYDKHAHPQPSLWHRVKMRPACQSGTQDNP